MTAIAPVIVKRGGFWSALAYGFFGLLTTIVVCATLLGFYGLYIADSKVGRVISLLTDTSASLVERLPEIQKNLPPALADALQDRRAPDYADKLSVNVKLEKTRARGATRAVFEIANRGDQTVTMLALRVAVTDEQQVPISDFVTYAATPLAIDEGEWRGPLLPGSTRRFSRWVYTRDDELTAATAEISDLRLWSADGATTAMAARNAGENGD